MGNIKTSIKKRFPLMYEYFLHIRRKKRIKDIENFKKIPASEYPKILEKEYYESIGHPLDWNNLQTYTEKMQWEKIYDINPQKSILADKYLVRGWVKEKIGEKYLIPLLGVWDNYNQIDFTSLPDKFVLKTNHGTGTNIIVKDKARLNKNITRLKIEDWLKMDYAFTNSLQLHYTNISRKIIAEQYLETDRGELQDYKFLCFDGKPYFCWVDLGRFSKHTRTVFDMKWKRQPWTQANYGVSDEIIPKPINFDEMIKIASILSEGFSHVRVDLYNVNGKIYFGEMTFTNGSGLDPIVPEKYDKELGQYWIIPE